ncbi:hypothetical protein D3C81_2115940 [compost metagenome]
MWVARLWRGHRRRELHRADGGKQCRVVTHHIGLRRFAGYLLVVAIQGGEAVPERLVIVTHARRRQVGQGIADHGKFEIVETLYLSALEQILP